MANNTNSSASRKSADAAYVITTKRLVLDDAIAPGWLHVKTGHVQASAHSPVPEELRDLPFDDVDSLVVMLGLMDCHVHINEPGRTEWEGFDTATSAAAAGGVTTLVDMPLNCSPVTVSAEKLAIKLGSLSGKLHV